MKHYGILLLAVFFSATPGAMSCVSVVRAADESPEKIADFENHIRPLLVKHCYDCHSEPEAAEGELLLNSRHGILQGGASGPAAVPGKPRESLLIQAVEYRGGMEMPPNGKLPKSEIDKLIHWVETGMVWPGADQPEEMVRKGRTFQFTEEHLQHWAFQPVSTPAPPEVDSAEWNQHPIDRFIYTALKQRNLPPNSPADKATLLRRVSYDLTGLPPTPAELQDFLHDNSPDAWSTVVERLLASPHYGERWGRHWLDVVRYADTAGDASDYPLPDAYKYRNYVIASFNQDKPYDVFLREQYAGDLLAKTAPAEKREELLTATTQLAIARRFGYNDTNFLYMHLTIQDLLDTMGQSVLGLSIGCARCHDHKFEPVSARDYYALYGIFSSSRFTFPGAEEVRRPKDLVPLVTAEAVKVLEAERAEQLRQIDQQMLPGQAAILNFEGNLEATPRLSPLWKTSPEVELVKTPSPSPFTNMNLTGAQVLQLPNTAQAAGFRRNFQPQSPENYRPLFLNIDFRNLASETEGAGHYRFALDYVPGYAPAVELFANGQGLYVREEQEFRELAPLQPEAWHNLQLAIDWKSRTFSVTLTSEHQSWQWEQLPFHPQWNGLANSFVVDTHNSPAGLVRPLRQFDNLVIQQQPLPPATHMVSDTVSNTVADAQQQLTRLREEQKAYADQKQKLQETPLFPTVYGVVEDKPVNAQIQYRGEPERLGEEVPRGFLSILGGQQLPDNCEESGRRELAEWLTSPENPLTARVMANRLWYYHFGRGIVATPNDFGVRGQPPTHPELLDYLATYFQTHGYSIKALHRLILSSRTYQLSAQVTEQMQAEDPENLWYSRSNRRRLDAESLRDTWLLLSGQLDLTPGGPHPFPPMSTWGYTQHNPFDAVYDSSKRSVYLMTQRIKRHPFLALFDGADPNATTGKRELTTTPAQALFMMNDEFMHRCSTGYASLLLKDSAPPTEAVVRLYRSAYSREPTAVELQTAERFLQRYAEQLSASEVTDAATLSLAALIRVVQSSNEFLYLH